MLDREAFGLDGEFGVMVALHHRRTYEGDGRLSSTWGFRDVASAIERCPENCPLCGVPINLGDDLDDLWADHGAREA